MAAALIRDVHRQLGYPGIQALTVGVKREAARQNVALPPAAQLRQQITDTVRTAGERQVFKPAKSGQAAVYALSKDQYWQVDLASFQHLENVKKNTGHKFLLIAVDVFSRFMRVEPPKEKTPEATSEAFKRILARAGAAHKCKQCGVDAGNEWKREFAELMTAENIDLRTKADPGMMNSLAVVDRAIQSYKAAMARRPLADKTSEWVSRAQTVADGLNETTTKATGAPPSAVNQGGNPEMELMIARKNAAKLEKSVQVFEKQRRGLNAGDSFRAQQGKQQRGITRRTGRPTFTDRVYTVAGFEGRNVRATSGQLFPLGMVMPVPAGTNAVSLNAQRAALRARQQQMRAARAR